MTNDCKRNMYCDKIHTLAPSQNFKVALDQLPLNTDNGIFVKALHLPGTLDSGFRRLWKMLKEQGKLNIQNIGEAIRDLNCNKHVRDALASRFHLFANSFSLIAQVKRYFLMKVSLNPRMQAAP